VVGSSKSELRIVNSGISNYFISTLGCVYSNCIFRKKAFYKSYFSVGLETQFEYAKFVYPGFQANFFSSDGLLICIYKMAGKLSFLKKDLSFTV